MLAHNTFSVVNFVFVNSEKTGSPGLQHSGLEQELLPLFFNGYLRALLHVLYFVPCKVREQEKAATLNTSCPEMLWSLRPQTYLTPDSTQPWVICSSLSRVCLSKQVGLGNLQRCLPTSTIPVKKFSTLLDLYIPIYYCIHLEISCV